MHVAVVLGRLKHFGGGFQYAQSILNALLGLPSGTFKITVVGSCEGWLDQFSSRSGLSEMPTTENALGKLARRVACATPQAIPIWQALSARISTVYATINALKPDLTVFPSEAHFALGCSGRTLAPIHDLMHRYESQFPEVKTERRRRDRTYAALTTHASGVLVDSELGREHVVHAYGADPRRVHVLPFVVPPYVDSPSRDLPDVRSRHALPDRFLFYPAQLWLHKNHVGLARAIGALRRRGMVVNLVACGAARNGVEAFKQTVKEEGITDQVVWLDYVPNDEAIALYKSAVAMIMPTFFGPTNIPPLEAFSLGCPVLASDVYAVRDQLGDAALYFDPRDVGAMAGQIARVWTDEAERARLTAAGRSHAGRWNQSAHRARLEAIIRAMVPPANQREWGRPDA